MCHKLINLQTFMTGYILNKKFTKSSHFLSYSENPERKKKKKKLLICQLNVEHSIEKRTQEWREKT